jgi:hypothetical protein
MDQTYFGAILPAVREATANYTDRLAVEHGITRRT